MKAREFRYCEGVVYIPLSQGLEAKIDLQDVEKVRGRNWCAHKIRRTIYAETRSQGVLIYLHRMVMQHSEGMEVDHINCDGLDNRRCNLRLASTAENLRNAPRSIRNTSGLKGVSFDKKTGRWRAGIVMRRRSIWLGRYATREEAHAAYIEASKNYHGEFGRTA